MKDWGNWKGWRATAMKQATLATIGLTWSGSWQVASALAVKSALIWPS